MPQVQAMMTTDEVATMIDALQRTPTTTGAARNLKGGAMTAVVTIGTTATMTGLPGMPVAATEDGLVEWTRRTRKALNDFAPSSSNMVFSLSLFALTRFVYPQIAQSIQGPLLDKNELGLDASKGSGHQVKWDDCRCGIGSDGKSSFPLNTRFAWALLPMFKVSVSSRAR